MHLSTVDELKSRQQKKANQVIKTSLKNHGTEAPTNRQLNSFTDSQTKPATVHEDLTFWNNGSKTMGIFFVHVIIYTIDPLRGRGRWRSRGQSNKIDIGLLTTVILAC